MPKTVFLSLLALAFVACSGSDDAGVTMTDGQRFDPEEYTVQVGEPVVWTNESSESHTVTAYEDDLPDGADYFASGATSETDARDDVAAQLIGAGERFEWTFDEPGTYTYFCIPHEDQGMVATIVVEE